MDKFQFNKGITLIEMVAIIVVVGISIPFLMLTWQDLSYRSARATTISKATFYAQELMEEIKSKRYDERENPPWTSNLGPDSETYPNFDDVDDFNGYSNTPASGYTGNATVDYVILNTSVNPPRWDGCGIVTCGSVTDCATCSQCCYKRINVRVSHQFGDSSLVTVVSGY